jgi:hypothetical protein
VFRDLVWAEDRVTLNGLTFLLAGRARGEPKPEDEHFWLYKDRTLLDEYDRLFADYPGLRVRNLLELGLWEGGSSALWMEVLRPEKYVGLDLVRREDGLAMLRYVGDRGLSDRLRTYWGTDQADGERLLQIVAAEFAAPLDLVIDDASHAYGPTRASFTTLFPLLREGGLYVVEDWPWQFVPSFRADFAPSEPGLLPLINDLSVLLIAVARLIRRVDVRRAFFVVERGPLPEAEARRLIAERWPAAPTGPGGEALNIKARRLKRHLGRLLRGG